MLSFSKANQNKKKKTLIQSRLVDKPPVTNFAAVPLFIFKTLEANYFERIISAQ